MVKNKPQERLTVRKVEMETGLKLLTILEAA